MVPFFPEDRQVDPDLPSFIYPLAAVGEPEMTSWAAVADVKTWRWNEASYSRRCAAKNWSCACGWECDSSDATDDIAAEAQWAHHRLRCERYIQWECRMCYKVDRIVVSNCSC